MLVALAIAAAAAITPPDSEPAARQGLRDIPVGVTRDAQPDTNPQQRRRRKAFEYSDAYATRLKIHKWASYATIPLFVAQGVTGEEMYRSYRTGTAPAAWARNTHGALAGTLGALFAVNTVTGGLNLWEGRNNPNGRTRRFIHSFLMLAADGGFALTAALAENERYSQAGRDRHKNAAIISGSAALGSYLIMLKPFRGD